MKGRIFNFQRYSIHDGPGIRSVVFLRGCPLRCVWCCNPESFSAGSVFKDEIEDVDVLSRVLEDEPYFKNSGGGLTISGGEPLAQLNFTRSLLEKCKTRNLNTALETCGHAPWESFEALEGLVDHYLYDIKHLNSEFHEKYTTRDNTLILDNLRRLNQRNENIFLRVPLIPEYNMEKKHIMEIVDLLKSISAKEIHLLPYHRFGEKKYAELKIPYPLKGRLSLMSYDEGRLAVKDFADVLSAHVENVYIGG